MVKRTLRSARYYDSDVARFLSLDPKASKYPSLSAYNYVGGNPLVFVDPDGRDIEPSEAFKKSAFYPVWISLSNSPFFRDKILKEYRTNKNYRYILAMDGESKNGNSVPLGEDGRTWYFDMNGYRDSKKNIVLTHITSEQLYTEEANSSRTQIGMAHLLIHESIHSHVGLNKIEGNDVNHTLWANYFGLMQTALKEFSDLNGMGYTDVQIKEMSMYGTDGAGVLEEYIQNKANDNDTTYETEYANYQERMNSVMWNK
ncbi:RHS repeat-associated core domain-containing protein [Fluviicola sp.]|uniref:RHS repeat-associated core domain-containing protein n=1 Tax=Fluviicola sp. TaxID=1917219 RepID=UPI0026332028|nr:RHS repeat-associated core domain-containing protein [Fluviicola sp.]